MQLQIISHPCTVRKVCRFVKKIHKAGLNYSNPIKRTLPMLGAGAEADPCPFDACSSVGAPDPAGA